ncbi:hypothetical protein C8J56DRAFT_1060583 [Mycena floridula]|nr:hypothetical protein C8J56DRAFT_1060583 [Mycena floridula]
MLGEGLGQGNKENTPLRSSSGISAKPVPPAVPSVAKAGKTKPASSTFSTEKMVQNARTTIKQVPVKRGIEDTLGDAIRLSTEAATEHTNRELILKEKAQVLEFFKVSVYDQEQMLEELNNIDDIYGLKKKKKPRRSSSPAWDCEGSGPLPADDDEDDEPETFNPSSDNFTVI